VQGSSGDKKICGPPKGSSLIPRTLGCWISTHSLYLPFYALAKNDAFSMDFTVCLLHHAGTASLIVSHLLALTYCSRALATNPLSKTSRSLLSLGSSIAVRRKYNNDCVSLCQVGAVLLPPPELIGESNKKGCGSLKLLPFLP
jgi:hypothetical protein